MLKRFSLTSSLIYDMLPFSDVQVSCCQTGCKEYIWTASMPLIAVEDMATNLETLKQALLIGFIPDGGHALQQSVAIGYVSVDEA